MKRLSIVIPCHNEAESLPLLVSEINNSVQSRDDIEILLVNDGSTDDSEQILEGLALEYPSISVINSPVNRGYGGAILLGLQATKGEYIGWMHGDLQTPFEDVIHALSVADASEFPKNLYIKGLRKGRSFFDRFFTFGMSVFESVLLQRKMLDVNAQPNIFHRDFFDTWRQPPHDFSLDLYALCMAHSRGLNLVRIPVIFPPRQFGQSHWNFGFASRLKFINRTIRYSLELAENLSHREKTFWASWLFFKYLIAGGTAGLVHLVLLFIFTEVFHIHYLISTSVALFLVFWISFYLQKYWTFGERSSDRIKQQVAHYFMMHSGNFVANGALMYLFVSVFGIWYMLSQVVISLSIAVVTFLINKRYIFKKEIE